MNEKQIMKITEHCINACNDDKIDLIQISENI